jgi:hypothetical protein
MKKFFVFLIAFVALGCVMPSAAVAQNNKTSANQCVPRDRCGNLCIPKTHRKTYAPAVKVQATTVATPAPQAPMPIDNELARVNSLTAQALAFGYQQNAEANKLTAIYNTALIVVEQEDADTRKYTAEQTADVNDRLATVEERNELAYEKYLPQHGRAEVLDAKAHMTDAVLGNFLRAGGEVGAAFLGRTQIGATTITSNGGAGATATIADSGNSKANGGAVTGSGNSSASAVGQGGAGGSADASQSQSQVQQQTQQQKQAANPSQSQSQVAP